MDLKKMAIFGIVALAVIGTAVPAGAWLGPLGGCGLGFGGFGPGCGLGFGGLFGPCGLFPFGLFSRPVPVPVPVPVAAPVPVVAPCAPPLATGCGPIADCYGLGGYGLGSAGYGFGTC